MNKISIRDKIWLWWHNYCPKHVTQKRALRGWPDYHHYCVECEEEKNQALLERTRIVEKKVQVLRGTQ